MADSPDQFARHCPHAKIATPIESLATIDSSHIAAQEGIMQMPLTSSDILAGCSASRVRGPQKAPRKVPLSLRIQPEILDAFRETGPGWQQRINAALADWLRTHAPSKLAVSRGAVQPDEFDRADTIAPGKSSSVSR